ncbi:MAG: NUDIX hydrolase [Chloroflexi bacterium]|nr:NUDIX hydrolase [Chloroflexota bacterium]
MWRACETRATLLENGDRLDAVKTRLEISAGGVIYRWEGDDTHVCLIATQGGKAWQLPKGIIEPGEPAEAAAQREVAEETGLRGELLRPLEKIEYWYVWEEHGVRTRVHKFVEFFLLRFLDGSTDDHDDEVDEARWFPIAEAQKRLSFDGERSVMRLAARALLEESQPGPG